jgi:protein phosphatase
MIKEDQSTSIIQRYLWAVGLDLKAFPQGTLLRDRYRVVESQIVVDTLIYKLPEIPDEINFYITAYLRLSRLPLHIPRPYGIVQVPLGEATTEVLLLDKVPISDDGKLLPNMHDSWVAASAINQVHLLWQVLQLWQPLQEQSMTSTLLEPEALRVDGSWVRVLQLWLNQDEISLADLGNIWVDWLPEAKPEVEEAFAEFFYGLSHGEFDLIEAIAYLDQLAQKQFETLPTPLTIRIASATDRGPRRDHNEDACYPDPEHQKRSQQSPKLRDRLSIICDGLGGHEGGEIASSMAIKTIKERLQVLLDQVETSDVDFVPAEFMAQLDIVVKAANEEIVNLNDKQFRQAQQRMGTTLVMAVAPRPHGKFGHEVYVVSVGDSRVYWVSAQGYEQVTIDDDVSTRDVMLGYNFHTYSSQRIDGGSLIQALGTRSSDLLHPRVQRLPIDQDCLFLLCSDGLSDYDRVNEIINSHIRPILTENLPLDQAVQDLINQANTRNGHDNVTVSLMRCQFIIPDPEPMEGMSADGSIEDFDTFFGSDLNLTQINDDLDLNPAPDLNQEAIAPPKNLLVLGIVIALILGIVVLISQSTPIQNWLEQISNQRSPNNQPK